jgi:cellulose synthase operon protein C
VRIPCLFYRRVALLLVLVSFFTACSRDPNVQKQKYFQSGERYYEKGRFAEATIEFRNAVGIDPTYADAHYHLALSYLKTQQWLRADQELARTIELQPENYPARVEMAKLLIAGGNLQQAQLQSDSLLKQRPNEASSHLVAANLLAARGRLPAAIQEMQKAIVLNSSDSDLYLNLALIQLKSSQSDAAEASFKKAIELDAKAINPRLMLANYYQMRSRFAEAKAQLQHAIESDPHDPDLRASVARLYLAQGKNLEAEEYLKQAKRDFPNNSVGYRLLGDFYFSGGEFDKAASEYANLHQEHAKDLVVKKNYVQLLVLTNRLDEARRLNDEILKKNPNDNDALLYSGQIQNRDGHVNGALNALQQLTKNDPNNALAHYELGIALQKSGDQDSAGREWRQAVRLRPDLDDAQRSLALLAIRKNDMTTLYDTATQMINLQPKSSEGFALRAVSEINRKQFDAADADIHKAIEVAPQSQFGYVQLGNLKFAQRQYVDAAEAYQDALSRDAGSTDALRGLMNAYIAQKQLDRALAVAEAQISKVPNDGAFYDLLGTALFYNKHDLPAADAAFRKSAELDRKNPDSLIRLGQVQAAEGQTDQAIDTFRHALQIYPREVNFYLLMGEMYQLKQDWSNAGDCYQRALVLTPENPLASAKLAYVMLQSGQNLDVALSLAQAARRGLPTSPAVADTLGWIYYQKGAYSSAIDSLQEAVRLSRESKSPDDPRTHLHLGMAFAKNGQSALARQQLQIVLKISPNSTDAAAAKKQLAQFKS